MRAERQTEEGATVAAEAREAFKALGESVAEIAA